MPAFDGCRRRSKRKLAGTIVFGGKTLTIQVCNSSGYIPESGFTQSELEVDGALWACGKRMRFIGFG